MATDGWVISLTAVAEAAGASTGNVTQLYPAWAPAGVAKIGSVLGDKLRYPLQGALHSIQVEPDEAADGGVIEIFDIDGSEIGADVSSGTTITNTQLVALIARGAAKLIWRQDFAGTIGSGPMNAAGIFRGFMKGLAARYSNVGAAGTCRINMVVEGGYRYTVSLGGY